MSFRFLTAGESHGKGLVGILEGLPSGLSITQDYIHGQLKRRKLGYGRGARMKIEDESVELLTGIRHGQTLGSPVCLMIANKDFSAWKEIMQSEPFTGEVRRKVEVPRPGHADLVGGMKYAHEDMRNVLERSSARETAMRVALGTVARRFLEELGISIASRVVRVASILDSEPMKLQVASLNAKVDASPVRCLGAQAEALMVKEIEKAKKEGNTLGGVFEVYAEGVPVGLGSYAQWDRRLEAEIGRAFLSLNAIKGVEIGMGFELGATPGTSAHDEMFPGSRPGQVTYRSNRSGGIDGGMSTGQPIVVRAVMKPLATLMDPLKSVNLKTGQAVEAHVERSDVCAVPAAAVIGESLLALSLTQAVLEKFGSDSMKELLPRVTTWKKKPAPRNIYLTGFMGSGKSSVGPLLAKELGWRFVDTDDLVEEIAGMSIRQIFDRKGEDYFRKLEMRVIRKVSEKASHVVSLGGGAILREENRDALSGTGAMVYLKATLGSLMKRLKEGRQLRPLLQQRTKGEVIERIRQLLLERKPLYEESDYTVITDRKSPAEVASSISRRLRLK